MRLKAAAYGTLPVSQIKAKIKSCRLGGASLLNVLKSVKSLKRVFEAL